MRTEELEGPYLYRACRVPNVFLFGVRQWKCPNCGETEVEIPALDGLHETLALGLANADVPLAGGAVHFLREYLAMYRDELAKNLGVGESEVLAWEAGAEMPPALDRKLREQVAIGVTRAPFDQPDRRSIGVKWTRDGWIREAVQQAAHA